MDKEGPNDLEDILIPISADKRTFQELEKLLFDNNTI